MFTNDELKSLQILLSRVDLKGNEAVTVALLQQKIGGMIASENPSAASPAKESAPEPKGSIIAEKLPD